MKTEALGDRLTTRLAEVKVETLVTSLSEIRAYALSNTLANRPEVVQFKTPAGKLAIVDAWPWSMQLQSG